MKPIFTDVPGAKQALGGMGTTRLYELMKRGELKRVKDGARTLITVESLEAYAAKLVDQAA